MKIIIEAANLEELKKAFEEFFPELSSIERKPMDKKADGIWSVRMCPVDF